MFTLRTCIWAGALFLTTTTIAIASENLALDTYTCGEFLQDTGKTGDGSKLLKSMMMISWATGYASGVQRDFVRADASALMLMAGTIGAACRKDPTRKVPEVVATLIQLAATARPTGGGETNSATSGCAASGGGNDEQSCTVALNQQIIMAESLIPVRLLASKQGVATMSISGNPKPYYLMAGEVEGFTPPQSNKTFCLRVAVVDSSDVKFLFWKSPTPNSC